MVVLVGRWTKLRVLLFVGVFVLGKCLAQTDLTRLSQACRVDSDCSPPYIVCASDQICRHKALFPMTSGEIGSLITLLMFLMVSIIVSIAGGVVIVPVASYWMGFSAKQAVALSNSIVLMTSFVKYLMGLTKKNPVVEYKTIIDYNAALLMVPPMALFSSIGGIIVTFLPDLLILVLLIGLMVYAVVSGYNNLKRQINKERSEKALNAEKAQIKELLLTRPAEEDKPDAPKGDAVAAEKVQPDEQKLDFTAEIEAQKQVESSNFVWKKFSVILAVMVLSILVAILRGGKGAPSVLGISRCSFGDWFVFLLYVGVIGYFVSKASDIIFEEQQHKTNIGWVKDKTEVHFDTSQYLFAAGWTSATGVLSAIVGVGGGILLNPLMMKLQFMPVTASWTINLNTVIGKIAAVIIHVMAGDLLYDYVFFYGGIIVVGIIISENTILEVVKKTKSQLFYPVAFLAVISICLSFVLFVGLDKWIKIRERGVDAWKFDSYC